jgi:hypothetical protein
MFLLHNSMIIATTTMSTVRMMMTGGVSQVVKLQFFSNQPRVVCTLYYAVCVSFLLLR